MSLLPVVVLVVVSVGLPLGYAWRVWRLDEPSRAGWLVTVCESAVVVILVLIVARWDIAGHYTRFALGALFVVAMVRSWRFHAGRPWRVGPSPWSGRRTTLASLVLLTAALAYVVSGLMPAGPVRDLAFPLRDGRFIVGQGGGNPVLNHHSGHREQDHAVDILAIDRAGFRAPGLLPGDRNRYVVYGAVVVSPCAGRVTGVRDGLADLDPPDRDSGNPAGNHVVIACGETVVELAHLQRASLRVGPGDSLNAGQAIARVGNSGNSTEPHLHLHAVDRRTGEAVPISFDGRSPVRNALFRR